MALSIDACKLHSNSLTAGPTTLAGWTHCAFCEGVMGMVKYHGQECTGRDHLFTSFFYLYFIGAPWYTIHHGWEALWYVTDMNIIPPLFLAILVVVTLRLLHEMLSAFHCPGAVRATMWSWQIPWWSLILFKPVWPLTCYMTTISSYNIRAAVCVWVRTDHYSFMRRIWWLIVNFLHYIKCCIKYIRNMQLCCSLFCLKKNLFHDKATSLFTLKLTNA